MDRQDGGIVAILPWLTLRQPVELRGFTFGTHRLDDAALAPLRGIVSVYRACDRPLDRMTLITATAQPGRLTLPGDRRADALQATRLLMLPLLAGLSPGTEQSAPAEGHGGYVNAEALEPHIYPAAALGQVPRGRIVPLLGIDLHQTWSSTTSMLEHRPPAVMSSALTPDEAFAVALDRAIEADSPVGRRVVETMAFVHDVLRDTARFNPSAVAMAAAAMVRLLDVDGAGSLAERIGDWLGHWGSIVAGELRTAFPHECRRMKFNERFRPQQERWWVHQLWSAHLYENRSAAMHAKDRGFDTWSLEEHLIVFRWVLPRLIKVMLATEGYYNLEPIDHVDLWLTDRWLAARPWYDRERHPVQRALRGAGAFLPLLRLLATNPDVRVREFLAGIPLLADDDPDTSGEQPEPAQ